MPVLIIELVVGTAVGPEHRRGGEPLLEEAAEIPVCMEILLRASISSSRTSTGRSESAAPSEFRLRGQIQSDGDFVRQLENCWMDGYHR